MPEVDMSRVLVQAPPTPSKYDIVPIHTSDRATFKFCRRQWAWSSPSRFNLIPRSQVHGIREPLWFGTGIHYALEKYYNPGIRQDPAATWLAWFDLQWNGGLVTADEVGEFVDREPVLVHNGEGLLNDYYRVAGLKDVLPFGDDPEVEEHFMQVRDLGRGMMEFYKDYAEREDNFAVIATEHDFSVPILDGEGKPLYRVDNRAMPEGWKPNFEENTYGPLMWDDVVNGEAVVMKQVHARGRMDLIIQDLENGRFGIKDYKTTARLDDDYFRHLELDEQCTTYLRCAEVEAELYDLEYKSVEFVCYEAILKGYPKPPTITKKGYPSINRQSETTTAKMFEQVIETMGLRPIFNMDIKMQEYYTWLLETGDKRFINRTETWRNRIQKANAGIRLYYEALDMLDPNLRLYPNPTKNYGCLNCIFRGPCIAVETGADFQSILDGGYERNWDR